MLKHGIEDSANSSSHSRLVTVSAISGDSLVDGVVGLGGLAK